MQASELLSHSAEYNTWMVFILFPLITLLATYLCRRAMHHAALLWVRFRSYQNVEHRYNADAAIEIEAPTCTALLNADQIAAQLCTPEDYLQWLNPQQALQKMTSTHAQYCEETVDALMDSTYPAAWAATPHTLRAQCYAHGERYLTPFLDDVIDDLIEHADTLFDFKETIRAQLKRQQFDQAGDFLRCMQHNSKALTRQQEPWALLLSPALALALLLCLPELSAAMLNASHSTRLGLLLSLVCGTLFLATLLANHKILPNLSRRPENTNRPESLPLHFEQPAKALGKTLTQTLLDIPSQIESLKNAPKRALLERIVARRFQQWFIDTLPNFGLKQTLGTGQCAKLLREEASFQCIQAMDRPFDDPDFIAYCQVRVEQALHQRIAKLSGSQFSHLLTQAQAHYRTGWLLLLLSVMGLTTTMLWLANA